MGNGTVRGIYVAGPLFTLGERTFNHRLAESLRQRLPGTMVVLPQEYAATIESHPDFIRRMFSHCFRTILRCDAIVAVLDGADADSGTCIELGFAYAMKKTIVGIRTDTRSSEDRGLNLMVSGVCRELIAVPSAVADIDQLADRIVGLLQ